VVGFGAGAGATGAAFPLVAFAAGKIFPARREITAASTIPTTTMTMTNTSSLMGAISYR
jgi:hypothetical protein